MDNGEYDAINRLTDVRDHNNTALARYTYDSLGRRSGLAYANGTSIDYSNVIPAKTGI